MGSGGTRKRHSCAKGGELPAVPTPRGDEAGGQEVAFRLDWVGPAATALHAKNGFKVVIYRFSDLYELMPY